MSDFQKFREETVPPEQRNWRNYYRDIKAFERWKKAQAWSWATFSSAHRGVKK